MVLISDTKYACETCIKGHRSSNCKHTDRPLFEIKRKGRPVTQCDHCRNLRQTKQVHIKCSCDGKEDIVKPTTSTSKKKASCNVPESAAFPNGLPEALGALVTLQPPSEGISSDSDHATGCACMSGGPCNCCTRRKSAPKNRKKTGSDVRHDHDDEDPTMNYDSPLSCQIFARIAELRPVRPKPPAGLRRDFVPHGQLDRHHTHESTFSPYGRAYECAHASDERKPEVSWREPSHDLTSPPIPPSNPDSLMCLHPSSTWSPTTVSTFPSSCGCGNACTCPGCVEHRGPIAATLSPAEAFSSCTNPGVCAHCLDCTINSLPEVFPLDTALSIPQTWDVGDWPYSSSSDIAASTATEFTRSVPSFQISVADDTMSSDMASANVNQPPFSTYGMLSRSVDMDANGFLTAPQLSRSRSSSGSSQSSHHSRMNSLSGRPSPFPKMMSPYPSSGSEGG